MDHKDRFINNKYNQENLFKTDQLQNQPIINEVIIMIHQRIIKAQELESKEKEQIIVI